MKIAATKTLLLAALVVTVGMAVATPAQARWYDGRHWHGGHAWAGYHWNPRLGYYVYGAPVAVMAPPPTAYAYAPPPPPVIVTQPAPVYYQPAPAYYAPAPVGLSLGVHIR
jgi:hypothetical protein